MRDPIDGLAYGAIAGYIIAWLLSVYFFATGGSCVGL